VCFADFLCDFCKACPHITAIKVQEVLSIADPTARLLIGFLEERGVLEEVTGRSWGKVWVALPILDALDKR
jgi:Fic family protein